MYLSPGTVHNVLHEEGYSSRSLLERNGQVSFNYRHSKISITILLEMTLACIGNLVFKHCDSCER